MFHGRKKIVELSRSLVNCAQFTAPARQKHSAVISKYISESDVNQYCKISGDYNPIHRAGDQAIVHGTYLLGLVSALVGKELPGPGTVISNVEARFINPCMVNSKVTIEVSCEKLRKITSMRFSITNDDTKELIASGKAKVLLLVRS